MQSLNLSLTLYIVVLSVLTTLAIYYSRRRFLLGKSLKEPLDIEAEAKELFGEFTRESNQDLTAEIPRIVESVARLEDLLKVIIERTLSPKEIGLLRMFLEERTIYEKEQLKGTNAQILGKLKNGHDEIRDELKSQFDKIMEFLESQYEIKKESNDLLDKQIAQFDENLIILSRGGEWKTN